MKKVLLGIATYKNVASYAFAYQMAILMEGVSSGIIERLHIEPDMYIPMARNKIAKSALHFWEKGEISHLLFIDDDTLIPRDGIKRLLDRELPVVGGLYFTRDLLPVAYSLNPSLDYLSFVPEKGLIQVDGTGCGCLLVECSIFEKMSKKYLDEWWFQTPIKDKAGGGKEFVGEDVFFFKRLKEMQIPAYIDCNIHCEHVGTGAATFESYKLKNSSAIAAKAMGLEDKNDVNKGDIGI